MSNDKTVTVTGSQHTGENVTSNEVAFSSDSLAKLQEGLAKTAEKTARVEQLLAEKRAAMPSIFVCNKCKKECKSLTGLKKHWSSAKNECKAEDGYTERKDDVNLTVEERMLPEELALAKKVAAARQAARQIAYQMSSKTANQGGFDAVRLMRYPIGNFARALKETETAELEKFVLMKFDSSTGPKKVMAQAELALRKSRANG